MVQPKSVISDYSEMVDLPEEIQDFGRGCADF